MREIKTKKKLVFLTISIIPVGVQGLLSQRQGTKHDAIKIK